MKGKHNKKPLLPRTQEELQRLIWSDSNNDKISNLHSTRPELFNNLPVIDQLNLQTFLENNNITTQSGPNWPSIFIILRGDVELKDILPVPSQDSEKAFMYLRNFPEEIKPDATPDIKEQVIHFLAEANWNDHNNKKIYASKIIDKEYGDPSDSSSKAVNWHILLNNLFHESYVTGEGITDPARTLKSLANLNYYDPDLLAALDAKLIAKFNSEEIASMEAAAIIKGMAKLGYYGQLSSHDLLDRCIGIIKNPEQARTIHALEEQNTLAFHLAMIYKDIENKTEASITTKGNLAQILKLNLTLIESSITNTALPDRPGKQSSILSSSPKFARKYMVAKQIVDQEIRSDFVEFALNAIKQFKAEPDPGSRFEDNIKNKLIKVGIPKEKIEAGRYDPATFSKIDIVIKPSEIFDKLIKIQVDGPTHFYLPDRERENQATKLNSQLLQDDLYHVFFRLSKDDSVYPIKKAYDTIMTEAEKNNSIDSLEAFPPLSPPTIPWSLSIPSKKNILMPPKPPEEIEGKYPDPQKKPKVRKVIQKCWILERPPEINSIG